MFRFRWLHELLGTPHSRKDRRRLAARKRKTVRLMLESLEERLTPSGGTVTQTAGGYTALTKAVAADTNANTNYVIEITQGFQFISGSQVAISKLGAGSTLTIEGQNGVNQTLTGNDNRLFTVGKGQTVTFENLTLTGGKFTKTTQAPQGGGAILDQGGDVTLSSVTVKGNSVTGSNANGGGIYASGGFVTGSSATLAIKGGSTIQSNHATATGVFTTTKGSKFGNDASGGGLYVAGFAGAMTVTISDSTISNNSAQGALGANGATPSAAGGFGGGAFGGGMAVGGSSWNAILAGVTFSGNSAIGGPGGNGATGSNASASSLSTSGGNGGAGGMGGFAIGGAASFNGDGNCNLTILNDLDAPTTHPSLMIDNSVQGGAGGSGGSGGASTGTAKNSNGGNGGQGGGSQGGALVVGITPITAGTANLVIGNTTIYGNQSTGAAGGVGASAGTGGSGAVGAAGTGQFGGFASGGGLEVQVAPPFSNVPVFNGNVTVFNSTVASNIVTGGAGGGSASQGGANGGGISITVPGVNSNSTVSLYNNTITQNSTSEAFASGAGVNVGFSFSQPGGSPPATSSIPTLYNNVIQGNTGGSSEDDLNAGTTTLSNAANNFIGTVGNNTPQLGSVVGVDSKGNPTGGPIYYPLLSGVASIGAGTTANNVLSTIASIEATTSTNASDELGNFRLTNSQIDLGAVEFGSTPAPPPSPSSPPSPPPAPPPSPSPAPTPSPSPAPSPPTPPPLSAPPLLAFLDQILGGTETVNADGTETVTDSLFGFPLFVSTFDSQGDLVSVMLFGINLTFLFE